MEDLLREAVNMGQASEVESLLQKGVNMNIVDENGLGLLHLACSVNEVKIVSLLAKFGADIDSVDQTGCTPLHVAYVRVSRFEEKEPAFAPLLYALNLLVSHSYLHILIIGDVYYADRVMCTWTDVSEDRLRAQKFWSRWVRNRR